VKLLARR